MLEDVEILSTHFSNLVPIRRPLWINIMIVPTGSIHLTRDVRFSCTIPIHDEQSCIMTLFRYS